MKRKICCIILLAVVLSSFIGCAGEKFTSESIKKYMDGAIPYILGLSADSDPGTAEVGEYDALIKEGTVVHMWGPQVGRTYVQDLGDPEKKEIADKLFDEYSLILGIVQECFEKGYFTEPANYPNDIILYTIYTNITDRGIELFPNHERIVRICIEINNKRAEKDAEGSLHIQRQYLIPRGLRVCIDYTNGECSDFGYGTAYNYGYDEDK